VTDVLVCIKRVPEIAGTVTLTDDAMAVDARHVGYTLSPHEVCAVELAVQTAGATDGEVTVVTVGDEDAVEQLRDALAVGCTGAVLVETEPDQVGPADVAAAIAEVVQAHEAEGRSYGLVLLGNDAADTGDFQVGIRLAYALGRPVLTGAARLEVTDGTITTWAEGPEGTEISEAPLPAVVTVMEGGVEPRYPSIPGRMKAKRVKIETVTPSRAPVGSGRVRLALPPSEASEVEVLGKGADAAPAVVDLLERLGVVR
jgi:electron transfer flavoprotein beta subunit